MPDSSDLTALRLQPDEDAASAVLSHHAAQGTSWAEALPQARAVLGSDLDLGQARRGYEQESGLAQARQHYANRTPTMWEELALHGIPVVSAIGQLGMAHARQQSLRRLRAGEATREDFFNVARAERYQELEEGAGFPLQAARVFQAAPAVFGEVALTGGIGSAGAGRLAGQAPRAAYGVVAPATAARALAGQALTAAGQVGAMTVSPGMWAPEVVANLERNGGNWTDARNLAPALGVAAINSAVLGAVARHGGTGVSGYLSRVAIGVGEQQAADTVSALAGLRHRGGVMEDLWAGRSGAAAQHATLQALTFALLGAAHHDFTPRQNPVVRSVERAIDRAGGPARAARPLERAQQWMREALVENPELTRPEALERARTLPEGMARSHAEALAQSLPERARPSLEQTEQQYAEVSQGAPLEQGPPDFTPVPRPPEAPNRATESLPPLEPMTPEQRRGWREHQPVLTSEAGRRRGEPPVPAGHVRFYHGGGDTKSGGRWLTPDPAYAEGYARKSGGRVHYVDLPENSPLLTRAFDDAGTSVRAPFNAFEAPPEVARRLRPLPERRTSSPISPEEAAQARQENLPPNAKAVEAQRAAQFAPEPPGTSAESRAAPKTPEPVQTSPAQNQGPSRAETTWHATGTEFRDRPDGSLEFTGRNGEPYNVRAEQLPAPEGQREHEGQQLVRVKIFDAEGREAGHVNFYSTADGAWTPEGLHVETRHRESKERRTGVSGALYDFMALNGQRVLPAKGQTEAGRKFWERNQELRARAEAERVPPPAEEARRVADEVAPAVEPDSVREANEAVRDWAELADEAGLNARERHALIEGVKFRTLEEIGADLGVTRQRAKQIQDAARAKLREAGINIDSIFEAIQKPEKASRAVELIENGKRTVRTDFSHDPETVGAVHERHDAVQEAVERIDAITEEWMKAKEKGTLTPEREAEFERQLFAEGEVAAGRPRPEAATTPELPGESPGETGSAGQAPVRRRAVRKTRPGAEAAEIPPAGEGGQAAGGRGQGEGAAGLRGAGAEAGGAARPPAAAQRGPAPGDQLAVGPGVESSPKLAGDITNREIWEHTFHGKPLGGGQPGVLAPVVERVKRFAASVWDGIRELGGAMAPRTSRLSATSGDAISRFNVSGTYAKELAPHLIDQVLGANGTEAERLLAGAVITERRLRHMRDYFLASGQPEKAAEVRTVIGREHSPLQTEADYQNALQSQRVQEILANFKRHVVPVMEANYRAAEGLGADDPITSPTQIPGEPVNLKAVRENDPHTAGVVRTGRAGEPTNPRQRKLGFAREATGAAEGYDIDLGAVIENSVAQGTGLAAKAAMYRALEADGLASWGAPGQQVRVRGQEAKELKEVRPPGGTQEATPGQTSLYLHPAVYGEVRRALQVDQPWPQMAGAALLSRATLASTVEAAYHSKNLLTFLFKPGVSPVDLAKNIHGVLAGDRATAARLVELARIGALKDSGMESGLLWGGRYDPTAWVSKFLDVLQRSMRLTADDAFNRLHRRGWALGSEGNRRDFINQLGQYNKRAQNSAVAFLRETGLGPFATAGSNYYMQGVRSLFMDPGVKATSPGAAVALRAEVLLRTVGVLAAVPFLNYLGWKNVFGDDKTPVGGVKVGEKDGRTSYIDLGALTGVTRGARVLGLLALAEGTRPGAQRLGATGRDVSARAVHDVVGGLTHPADGPVVNFLHTLVTGRDATGSHVARRVTSNTTPEGIHRATERGEAHPETWEAWVNLQAALWHANPLIAALSGQDRPTHQSGIDERLWKLLGPYGVRSRAEPPGAPHRTREVPQPTQQQRQNRPSL